MTVEANPAPEGAGPGTGTPAAESTPPTPAEGGGGGGKHDAHLEKAKKERNALKAQLHEARTKLAEYESQAETLAEQKEREAGEFAKLQERYEAKVSKLTEKVNAYEALEVQRTKEQRFTALAEAVRKKGGTDASPARVRALLREAAATKGIDIAPEGDPEEHAGDVLDVLRELDPDTFKSKSRTAGSPLPAGFDPNTIDQSQLTPEQRDEFRKKVTQQQGVQGMTRWTQMGRR